MKYFAIYNSSDARIFVNGVIVQDHNYCVVALVEGDQVVINLEEVDEIESVSTFCLISRKGEMFLSEIGESSPEILCDQDFAIEAGLPDHVEADFFAVV